MSDHRVTIEEVWDCLQKFFPNEDVGTWRTREANPAEAFDAVKKQFAADVAARSPEFNDINKEGAKQRMILGHILLAVFDALKRGRKEFMPFPRVANQPWATQETALLLWAAQHGTSDGRKEAPLDQSDEILT